MSPAELSYDATRTALLFVDPYNDFLAEDGKLWHLVKDVAQAVHLHDNLRAALSAARASGLAVFIVPHHQWVPGDMENWDHPSPYQLGSARAQVFARGSWGAEWYPDFTPQPGEIVVKEHWGGSGFANTDLDMLLKQRKVTHVILIGLIANTCIETTGRFASELGYHVTLVRDATAAASPEALHSAHEINGPTYAHAIVTTNELIAALKGDGSRPEV
ncbi:cysteine hydrolase [Mesorhizobium sp. B2-3-3]|uniref:isochorismatase family cysteine hydrolase n=1 Tax=Mesorhizobium sp. B2-3-5 TaxID=2589958 RepID=UPI001129FA37|nr:isochorismatase family cysteine hydrolase [Mesorhizobium sp. B2-3-5]TPM24787.1 cysteine hydrolase [Mesorhizobium sp. B2-3-5]TPN33611.1 cysteine hydrolase [Mesorhizobium sp. B2-3-3]